MVNYHKQKGKGELPIFCGNGERLIPVYAVEEALATSNFVAAACAGADIPRWGDTGHWGLPTCWAGPFGASAIRVMAGPGLAVTVGEGPGVAGLAMDGPGGSGVNPQGGADKERAVCCGGWLGQAKDG